MLWSTNEVEKENSTQNDFMFIISSRKIRLPLCYQSNVLYKNCNEGESLVDITGANLSTFLVLNYVLDIFCQK